MNQILVAVEISFLLFFNFGVVPFFVLRRLVMGSRWIKKKTNTLISGLGLPRGVAVSARICIVVCECIRVLIELESFHQLVILII